MFRRDFFASLGLSVLPFGFLMKKPEKETCVNLGSDKLYFKNGYIYKKVCIDKTCYYNEKGKYHREDGPAIEYGSGYGGHKIWYLDGKFMTIKGTNFIKN